MNINSLGALFISTALLTGCDQSKKIDEELLNQNNRIANLERELAELKTVASKEARRAPGSTFNSCVLENLKGTTADLAAQFIKTSCIHAAEAAIPSETMDTLLAAKAAYGPIYGSLGRNEHGLHIIYNNTSAYTLTELRIVVVDKQTKRPKEYVVTNFPTPLPAGVVITGLPADRTAEMVLPPGEHTFTVPIAESVEDPSTFFQSYGWQISGAKGFVN